MHALVAVKVNAECYREILGLQVLRVMAVEAEDRVQVHDAARLEFGDFGVAQPHVHAVPGRESAQGAGEGVDGAGPQFRGKCLPGGLPVTVVAP